MKRQFIPEPDRKYEFLAQIGSKAPRNRLLTYVFARMGLPALTDGQNHAVLPVIHGGEEARHLVLAKHDGKLLRLTACRDVVLDNPGPFEGHCVEEPERGDRDNDRTCRETSFSRQMEQPGADLRWPEKIGRFTKMAGEVDALRDIHTLRVRCQVPNLHVFDHATAKRAHGQLLCEMDCATR